MRKIKEHKTKYALVFDINQKLVSEYKMLSLKYFFFSTNTFDKTLIMCTKHSFTKFVTGFFHSLKAKRDFPFK